MITPDLIQELIKTMTLKRLYHSGLFQRLPILDEELTAEIRLHRAVLDQALLDTFSPDKNTKKDVEQWLDLNNPEFTDACYRADLDPILCYELFIQIKKILSGTNADPFQPLI